MYYLIQMTMRDYPMVFPGPDPAVWEGEVLDLEDFSVDTNLPENFVKPLSVTTTVSLTLSGKQDINFFCS